MGTTSHPPPRSILPIPAPLFNLPLIEPPRPSSALQNNQLLTAARVPPVPRVPFSANDALLAALQPLLPLPQLMLVVQFDAAPHQPPNADARVLAEDLWRRRRRGDLHRDAHFDVVSASVIAARRRSSSRRRRWWWWRSGVLARDLERVRLHDTPTLTPYVSVLLPRRCRRRSMQRRRVVLLVIEMRARRTVAFDFSQRDAALEAHAAQALSRRGRAARAHRRAGRGAGELAPLVLVVAAAGGTEGGAGVRGVCVAGGHGDGAEDGGEDVGEEGFAAGEAAAGDG